MGFFGGRRDQHAGGHALPPNIVTMLERYGRFEWEPQSSAVPTEEVGALMSSLYALASAEPERFLANIAAAVLPAGGWAVYGASCAVWDVLTPKRDSPLNQNPAYKAIMDAAISFLRSNGVPPMRVRGYEWDYWIDSGGTRDTWLPRRPIPALGEAPITDLRPGEIRRVIQITERPDSNVIHVQRQDNGQFHALIESRQSDDDPRRALREWKSAGSLHELYIEIGLSMQTPTYWYDREMEPYFPLPRPKI